MGHPRNRRWARALRGRRLGAESRVRAKRTGRSACATESHRVRNTLRDAADRARTAIRLRRPPLREEREGWGTRGTGAGLVRCREDSWVSRVGCAQSAQARVPVLLKAGVRRRRARKARMRRLAFPGKWVRRKSPIGRLALPGNCVEHYWKRRAVSALFRRLSAAST